MLCTRRSRSAGWPTARGLLLLQLFVRTFPPADRKHPVCTPMARLLGFLLTVCPLHCAANVAPALFVAALLQSMAAAGQRYAPEVTPMVEALLQSAVKAKHRVPECDHAHRCHCDVLSRMADLACASFRECMATKGAGAFAAGTPVQSAAVHGKPSALGWHAGSSSARAMC